MDDIQELYNTEDFLKLLNMDIRSFKVLEEIGIFKPIFSSDGHKFYTHKQYTDFDEKIYLNKKVHYYNADTLYPILNGADISQEEDVYLYLGAWYNSSVSNDLVLDIYTGEGFNGDGNENIYIKTFIKKAWKEDDDNLENCFGSISYIHVNYYRRSDIYQVLVYAVTKDVLKIYLKVAPNTYSRGFYSILNYGGFWIGAEGGQTEEPEGVLQTSNNYIVKGELIEEHIEEETVEEKEEVPKEYEFTDRGFMQDDPLEEDLLNYMNKLDLIDMVMKMNERIEKLEEQLSKIQ